MIGRPRGAVGVEWSAVATVRSGRRTRSPRARRPVNACGLVTSWTRWRSIARTAGAPSSWATTWSSQIFSTSVRGRGARCRGAGVGHGAAAPDRWAFDREAEAYQRARPAAARRMGRALDSASRHAQGTAAPGCSPAGRSSRPGRPPGRGRGGGSRSRVIAGLVVAGVGGSAGHGAEPVAASGPACSAGRLAGAGEDPAVAIPASSNARWSEPPPRSTPAGVPPARLDPAATTSARSALDPAGAPASS